MRYRLRVVPMDPRERFTATVEAYRRHRPAYPDGLMSWICVEAGLRPGDRVVDVGCGTGISTRQLAAAGLRVIGLDPNEAMLEAARAAGSDRRITWVVGDGERLPIDARLEEPLAAIVGGQSFHWLDLGRALPRFRSVLRPGGRIVAFWNLRDCRQPLMAAYESLLRERCPEYLRGGAEPRARAILARDDLDDRRRLTLAHHQLFDRDGFLGRVWSSSYVRHGVGDRASFDQALHRLFDAHQRDGRVRFDYVTEAVAFR